MTVPAARTGSSGVAAASRLGALPAIVVAVAVACGPGSAPRRPAHVVILSADSLRADHCSLYGYERETTPQLSRLADEAVVYRNAHAQGSWTRISYASMFTGQWNSDLAGMNHLAGKSRGGLDDKPYENPFGIPDDAATFASQLATSGYGYASIGRGHNPNIAPELNFGVGFDSFDSKAGFTVPEILPQALGALDELASTGEPFLLFVHFQTTHYPFFLADPAAAELWKEEGEEPVDEAFVSKVLSSKGRILRAPEYKQAYATPAARRALADRLMLRYDRAIAEVDAAVGTIVARLRELGVWDDTLLVFNSDHGEEFLDRGEWGHGHSLFEEMIRVPLLIKFPAAEGIEAQVVERPVSNLDILPTVLVSAGLPVDAPWIRGRDLRPTSQLRDAHPYPVSEHGPATKYPRPGELSIRGPRYKLIYRFDDPEDDSRPTILAFDMVEDPQERRPLPPGDPRVAHLRRALDEWIVTHRDPLDALAARAAARPGGTTEPELSEETLRELRELGYIGEDG